MIVNFNIFLHYFYEVLDLKKSSTCSLYGKKINQANKEKKTTLNNFLIDLNVIKTCSIGVDNKINR